MREFVEPPEFVFPCMDGQKGMWLLDRVDPGNVAFNIPIKYTIRGTLDSSRLRRAIQGVVDRQESLRTSFVNRDGVPWQLVRSEVEISLDEYDLRNVNKSDQELSVDRLCAERAVTKFDLSSAPLFKCCLVRLSPEQSLLLVVVHHIIFDGWSASIFEDDLATFYRAEESGEIPEDLAFQVGEIAVSQEKALNSRRGAKLAEFWSKVLDNIPAKGSGVPAKSQALDVLGIPVQRLTSCIDLETSAKIGEFAKSLRTTPYCVLFAVYVAALHSFGKRKDLLVGTPMACRPEGGAGLIGFLVNDVVVRCRLDSEASFSDLVREIAATVLSAYEHREFPFLKLVELVRPKSILTANPIYEAWFAFHEFPMRRMSAGADFDIEHEFLEKKHSWIPLALDVRRDKAGLRLDLTYAHDRFGQGTAELLLRRFEQILNAALLSAGSGQVAETINRLHGPTRENYSLCGEFKRDLPELALLIKKQIECRGDHPAIRWRDRSISYSELGRRVEAIRCEINRCCDNGAPVAIYADRNPTMVASIVAALFAGVPFLPLDPSYPLERTEFMLSHSGAQLIIESTDEAKRTVNTSIPKLRLDDDRSIASGQLQLVGNLNPKRTAYLLYTSGSTGLPKGVVINAESLANTLLSLAARPGFGPADSFIATTTICFDISLVEMLLPLICGGRVVLADRTALIEPTRLADLLRNESVTVMQATPTAWRMLIENGWQGRPGLRAWSGGEGLPSRLAKEMLGRCDELWNVYGPTETTIWSAAMRIEPRELMEIPNGFAPIGGALDNTVIVLLDESDGIVEDGGFGEICIGGVGLAVGYLRDDHQTNRAFFHREGFGRLYRTGDIGRRLSSGVIEFLGRRDRQVKIRGHRVELGEIDANLMMLETVEFAISKTFAKSSDDLSVVSFVVLKKAHASSTENSLVSHLRARLPEYMVPKRVVIVGLLPLTPNGKVDVEKLAEPCYEHRVAEIDDEAVTSLREIHRMWQTILKRNDFGLDTSFLEVGGHSLDASKIVAALNAAYGVKLTIRTAYEAQTVREMSAAVHVALGH